MEREYARMMNASRRAIATATFEDRHFFPQNWLVFSFLLFKACGLLHKTP
jgi:hypothetical protein